MSRDLVIRAIGDADVEAWVELRREALLDSPLSFASSPDDDLGASAAAARRQLREQPESAIFAAFDGPKPAGSVGIRRDVHQKCAHKAHIWGMYVSPAARRRGLARALLDATLAYAATLRGVTWVQLSVSSTAPGAQRLYEAAGFRVWGTEPDALIYDGETALEHYMALRLCDRG